MRYKISIGSILVIMAAWPIMIIIGYFSSDITLLVPVLTVITGLALYLANDFKTMFALCLAYLACFSILFQLFLFNAFKNKDAFETYLLIIISWQTIIVMFVLSRYRLIVRVIQAIYRNKAFFWYCVRNRGKSTLSVIGKK